VKLARLRQGEADTGRETFEIRKVFERRAKIAQQNCTVHQFRYSPLALSDFLEVVAGPHQPVPQHA
jgi:hypothetical protein